MKFKKPFVLAMALVVIASAAYLQYQRSQGNMPPVTGQVETSITTIA